MKLIKKIRKNKQIYKVTYCEYFYSIDPLGLTKTDITVIWKSKRDDASGNLSTDAKFNNCLKVLAW